MKRYVALLMAASNHVFSGSLWNGQERCVRQLRARKGMIL